MKHCEQDFHLCISEHINDKIAERYYEKSQLRKKKTQSISQNINKFLNETI